MAVARPVRTPTVPPPANLTSNDLPRGAFTYPDLPRRGNVLLKVAAAIGVTVLGFFAVVYILDKKDAPSTKVASETPATPTTPIDPPPVGSAAGTTPGSATPTGSATTEPEIEMDTGEPPPATGSAAIPAGSTASGSGTRPRPGTPTPRPVTTPKAGSAADTTAATATPEPATPTPNPEFTEADLCDEANCVLSDYDRPCCAKYKPKGPVIAQRVGGVPQSLDRSMVRAGVDGIKPRVIACGEKANVQGTVKIAVSVSPEGLVTSSDVQDTPDAALGTCVAGALRSAKFGKSVDGGSFTYPFVF